MCIVVSYLYIKLQLNFEYIDYEITNYTKLATVAGFKESILE